jgi:hypothetical protein
MALCIPVSEVATVSVAVIVRSPTVLSVTLNVPTPEVSVDDEGNTAAPSLLVIATVPA